VSKFDKINFYKIRRKTTHCYEEYKSFASDSWFISRSLSMLGSLILVKKNHLENDHWEDLKANRKLEVHLRDMALDVDKIRAGELKLCHFPQDL